MVKKKKLSGQLKDEFLLYNTYTYPLSQYPDQDIEYFYYPLSGFLPHLYVLQCNYYSKLYYKWLILLSLEVDITENNGSSPSVLAYSFIPDNTCEFYLRVFRISKYCQRSKASVPIYTPYRVRQCATFSTSLAKLPVICLCSFHRLGGDRAISLWLNLHMPGY